MSVRFLKKSRSWLGIGIGALAILAIGPAGSAVHSEAALVGGKSIGIAEAPWQLLNHMVFPDTTEFCGAIWLGGRWALTAGHCSDSVTADQLQIFAGITTRAESRTASFTRVKRIILHPSYKRDMYNPSNMQDFALLELAADITAPLAKPIRYATAADALSGLIKVGTPVVMTGWGWRDNAKTLAADSLQMVTSKIKSLEKYVIHWGGFGGTTLLGSCFGDSGGPMVVRDASGNWVVAGVSSYISSYCGDPNMPSTYARVSAVADWIRDTMGPATGLPHADGALLSQPISFAGGRILLAQPQTLVFSPLDLNGKSGREVRRFYPAGEHGLPDFGGKSGGGNGGMSGKPLLQIRGEGFTLRVLR